LNVTWEFGEGMRRDEVTGKVVKVNEDFVAVADCRTQVVIAYRKKINKYLMNDK
jgi:hypothetical protein